MQYLRFLVSVVLQLLFGGFAVAGLGGVIALIAYWPSSEQDERGLLAILGILAVCSLVAGLYGIVVTRKRARGESTDGIPWDEYEHRGPLARIVAGTLMITAAVGWICLIRWGLEHDLAPRHFGFACDILIVGVFQLASGVRLRLREKKEASAAPLF